MTNDVESNTNYQVLRLFINADIVARDKNGNPILLVDVRMNTMHSQVGSQIINSLAQTNGSIPFAMLVNAEEISIFKWGGEQWKEPICKLETVNVLSEYEPEFRHKRIFHSYFVSLVEAWLRDLAYHWHSQHPPFLEEIQNIGLLEKLTNGTTEEETEVVEVKV